MSDKLQSVAELDAFYAKADPWGYQHHPDDRRRQAELLGLLPERHYGRVLDIGCGDGFVTFSLPGDEVTGVDISPRAIGLARAAAAGRQGGGRFRFLAASLFDLDLLHLGQFDLVVVTGVLYPQYIGNAVSVARLRIDGLLVAGGILATCHIREWNPPRFPYTRLDAALYPYRERTHQLEIYRK